MLPVSVVDSLCYLSAWWTRFVTCQRGGLRAVCDEALRSLWSSCSQPRRVCVWGYSSGQGASTAQADYLNPALVSRPAVAAVK